MMETWVYRWGERVGLAPRLTDFFSTRKAQALVQAFRASDTDEEADPDVLPFLLLYVVWPEQELAKVLPLPNVRKRTASQFRVTARHLRTVSDTILSAPPLSVPAVAKQLDQWATYLEDHAHVHIGYLTFSGHLPHPQRHRAKRQVVFFLTGYFASLGRAMPPWPVITEFLILAGLAASGTKPKSIATWWSNLLKREVTPEDPIEPFQKGFILLFQHVKKLVAIGDEGLGGQKAVS